MTSVNTDRIVKEIELAATPDRVWKALTDVREFNTWFGSQLRDPFEVGKPSSGPNPGCGHEDLVMTITVVEMDEGARRFAYRWHPYAIDHEMDYTNEPTTLVEFTLRATPTGTLLTVTESGFDAVPLERRAEAFRMHTQGWEAQLENIDRYVNKKAPAGQA